MPEKNPLEINPELVSKVLVGFIRDQLHKVDMQKVVVGLSGGIDSATSTYLAVRALDSENVWAINMPYKTSSPESAGDAGLVIKTLDLPSMTIEITDLVKGGRGDFSESTLKSTVLPFNKGGGVLYVVSTPIGNLEDITLRALRILKEVDLIAAEDTRHTRKLLTHYDIHTPLTSFFEGNQIRKTQSLTEKLLQGQNIALVSDAGTPGISDPGYPIIKFCIDAGIQIVPIPGPSACVVAAVISGFPLHNFVFEGFLSPKSGKRRKHLESLRDEARTLIFYESPHRLIKFLSDALEILSDREIVIACELTKLFEEIYRGKISEAIEKFQQEQPRGEFTIVIRGNDM